MTIRLERSGRITVLTLDRPPVNALDTGFWIDLDARLDELDPSRDRCVVVAAAGTRAFSAGADIKEFDQFLAPGAGRVMALRIHEALNRLERLDIVTLAAVEGAALGGGCELILACDLRVAGQAARFGFPEVMVGQFPGTGGTMRLPWLVGESRAKELLLTGRAVSSDEALRIGLVHRIVAAGQALEAALAWASELALLPRPGVAAVKRSIAAGRGADPSDQSRFDSDLSEEVFQSPEAVEGYHAFLEKRTPAFAHPLREED